ncbi:MAG: S53 family peptidase [Terracidiphilus sp.]
MPQLPYRSLSSIALLPVGRLSLAFRPMLFLLAAVVFAGVALSAQTPLRITRGVDATQARALPDHHPSWANPANSKGLLPAEQALNPMTLVLARSPEQESAFENFLADQQNPASPEYHHWLTPAEVGERFGLADQDISTLSGWLQSQGLRINWVSPSKVFIGFSGTAANLGRAFQTEFHSYNVNGVERVSVSSDPMIPEALLPAIKAIDGLYTVENRPAYHAGAGQSNTPAENSNSGNHYITPADFAVLYDLPLSLTGAGQTIGIVGRAHTDFADFSNFRSLTGSTFANPTEVVPSAFGGVDPGPAVTSCTSPCTAPDDQVEATLDVLRAGSTAPGANLLLVIDTTASGDIEADAQYLVQTTPVPAKVMNISFGKCESTAGPSKVNTWNTLFQQAAGEGISVFVCSGDSGASECDTYFATPPASPAANSPNYICSSGYATCVGGTEFNDASNPSTYWSSSNGTDLLSALSYIPEGAWNEPLTSSSSPQAAASGGGVSAVIATPSWQTGTGVPSARTGRYTPDIAFSSAGHDGYFACLAAAGNSCVAGTGGGYTFEYFYGTSAAAPSMAGIAALLNQKQGTAQGNLNPQLYPLAARVPAAFHDVTVASSGVTNCSISTPSMCNNSIPSSTGLTGGQQGYLVTTGYDEVTGLGSLDVQVFIDNFLPAGDVTPTVTVSGTTVSVTPGATTGNISTITVTPANGFTGSVALTAAITSSPSGAQYAPTLSFGSTSPVTITGATAATATLTVSTTAASYSELVYPMHRGGVPWYGAGTALACLLFFGIPARRRSWRIMFGMLGFLLIVTGGVLACGSGGSGGGGGTSIPGTTAGAYTVTITCTSSGTTLSTGTLTLNVQ